jgi:dihydrofolate reductase/DNA-binding MarR family transcriptional regulator
MGLLTFSLNVTLDGCVDHREGIADDETHAFFTRLMDEAGAMLWGRVTYEMMESYWPAVARGDEEAPPAMREWALKLEAKPKYVVSSTRKTFPWTNSHRVAGDLRAGVQKLKDATPAGVLLGSGKLATELDRLDLIDEYKFLVHPRIAGHGPTLYQSGLPSTRRLELVSANPLRNGAVAMHYRRARAQQPVAADGPLRAAAEPERYAEKNPRAMSEQRKQLPIGYWLKRADELLTKRIDEAQRINGLTRLAWQVLNIIRQGGTARHGEIIDTLRPFAEASTLDDVLGGLAARGVVSGSTASGFELTSAGTELYDSAFLAQRAIRQRAVAGISETEYATTVRVIQQIVANLEREAPA